MANGMQIITAKGLRATPQRIAILEALLPRKDHPTVEVLYHDVHARYPSVSLNTVYTTLVSLEKAGLIQRIDAGDGHYRYDGNPNVHTHIVCTSCQRVDDVQLQSNALPEGLLQEAATSSGYTISFSALYFYGRCPKCSNELNNKPCNQPTYEGTDLPRE